MSVTNMCPGEWVIANGGREDASRRVVVLERSETAPR